MPPAIKVRAYPLREQDGLLDLHGGARPRDGRAKGEPPKVGIANAKPRWIESQTFACNIDHAVIGLMDPAHAPYVHGRWWWRVKPRVKSKDYAPLPRRFRDAQRTRPPNPPISCSAADVSTEITFELPGNPLREHRGDLPGPADRRRGLTVCTPIDEDTTQVTQIFYWPAWLGFIKPFFMALGPTFLGDDRRMVELQKEGLKFDPPLMLIQDSDVPAMWYHRLKKAWAKSVETGAPFVNPVQARDAAVAKLSDRPARRPVFPTALGCIGRGLPPRVSSPG